LYLLNRLHYLSVTLEVPRFVYPVAAVRRACRGKICALWSLTMHLPPLIRRVLDSLHGPEGYLARDLRVAASDHAALSAGARRDPTACPSALTSYVDKVSRAAYKVTDRDIAALVQAGLSENQIFELTVVTAVGAALGRFEKTLELLEEAPT
jgi:alkylhydroperoxidase family enzyme